MTLRSRLFFAYSLLTVGCAAQPTLPMPAAPAAVAGTVSLSLSLAAPRSLLSTVRQWTAGDVHHYHLRLQRQVSPGTFGDLGPEQDVSTTAGTTARFDHLAGGQYYRVVVEAWGNEGGTAGSSQLNTKTACDVDFDLTGQDIPNNQTKTATVTLDAMGFSGTAVITPGNTPAGTASEVVELWEQGGSAAIATQTLAYAASKLTLGGLSAGKTYYVKVTAKDGSGSVLETAQSATFSYDGSATTLEQSVTPTFAFTGAAPHTAGLVQTVTVSGTPYQAAVDTSGNVWVPDANVGDIWEYSSSGVLLGSFNVGDYADFIAPAPDGSVWVAVGNSPRGLQQITPGRTLGTHVALSSTSQSSTLAIDTAGNLWVPMGSVVKEFDSAGNLLGLASLSGLDAGAPVSDASGNTWIHYTDHGSTNKYVKYASNRTVVTTVNLPDAADADSAAVSHADGTLWYTTGGALHEYSSAGVLVGTLNRNDCFGVTVDLQGDAWVTIPDNNSNGQDKVIEVSPALSVLTSYATGPFPYLPTTDPVNGTIWVPIAGNATVEQFQP